MVKKPVIELGERVPRSLKFGIIVAVALFWAQFLRGLMAETFYYYFNEQSALLVDFIVAVIATIVGWLILAAYPKIRSKLSRVKV